MVVTARDRGNQSAGKEASPGKRHELAWQHHWPAAGRGADVSGLVGAPVSKKSRCSSSSAVASGRIEQDDSDLALYALFSPLMFLCVDRLHDKFLFINRLDVLN